MNGNKRKIINVGWGSERDIEIEMEVNTWYIREKEWQRHIQTKEKRERETKYLAFDFPPCGIVVVQAN